MKLIIENVKKNFAEKEVLKDIDFTFEEGKIYGLLGRNGAGKTTLFNCLNGDIGVDTGAFYLQEEGINRKLKTSDIGYVLSTPVVPEFLTAREFLKFFIEINQDKIEDLKSIDEYFEFLSIEIEDRDKLMKDYSHGMKSKMQMLICVISKPKVILLDEPLTSFDIVVADEMKNLFKTLKEDHILVFSTHILELATDLCDEIVVLNHGILEEIDKEDLNNQEFEQKIVSVLRGE